ncbi:glutamine-hydrolyzing carbamoyl-phosphate synthase small subunit [Crassaminicella thermophila]|uniref:Carbamoyl phosphate synthase small chain n=1 Tax=Crassaminicella thermophila TaxID=2599308 RepID=A0A5C0S8T4_CRATE|nr:glutamine-hydrolyzing carbamoyl-phosphate synthase small subunit [Crassaminicella thermophila]QEK10943.1 glutamine-hydrolyzing carbamoyl-phosphate synthase small subunit [Crassaminicella thermophila]
MNGILYLEDGTVYKGKGFGKVGTSVGELVFNTSITGYQEILTDPSYAGQIITMTYPLIGNYGVNNEESESSKVYAKGFVTKSISKTPSNYMSEKSLEDMLKDMGVVGVCDVDTRSITKRIRNQGALKCIISNENLSIKELEDILKKSSLKEDWMKSAGTDKVFHIPGTGPKIAVMDFGIKRNIINNLKYRGCDITVFPYYTTYDEIMNLNPDGVLLSNGPGNPEAAIEGIETVKKIIQKVPTFGICMGHQVLALAVGGSTYKMKYGHRGGNHGVYDIHKDRAYITSQNHGYAVDRKSVEDKGMEITHINLNDDTVEGMQHKELPVFSVQFHPEGAPGPTDSTYLFDKFIDQLKEDKKCL